MSKFKDACKDIEQPGWDISKVRDKLRRNIDAYVTSVRTIKLSELMSLYEDKLNKVLAEPVEAFLDFASDDSWPEIRRLLQRETKIVVSDFTSAISSFDVDQTTVEKLLAKLEEYARCVVESKAREVAETILMRMRDRFSTFFRWNSRSMPILWTENENIKESTKTACLVSLKLLSVITAIRLDDDMDNIESTLQLALMEVPNSSTSNRSIQLLDSLTFTTWENVSPTRTLIRPDQCKSLWMQFKAEREYFVKQAIDAQEFNKMMNNNWMPCSWAIATAAMLISVTYCFVNLRRLS